MTLVVPFGYASVVQTFTWAGDPEPVAITYGVVTNGAGPPASAAALAADLRDNFSATMLGPLDGIISMLQTEVSWQEDPLPAPPVIGVAAGGGSGAGTLGSVLPQNSAFLVHKRTGVGGRGGRGRLYLPAVDESAVNDVGVVTGSVVTAWNTALAAWLAAIQAETTYLDMVLFHDSLGAFAAEDPYVVTSLIIDTQIATQRRRLRR